MNTGSHRPRDAEGSRRPGELIHDVRNSIATIKLQLSSLRRSHDDPRHLEAVEAVERNVNELHGQLQQLFVLVETGTKGG